MNLFYKHGIKIGLCIILWGILSNCSFAQFGGSSEENRDYSSDSVGTEPLLVKRCNEFTITGNGSNPEWEKVEWSFLTKLDNGGRDYLSKFKVMASPTGIYVLFYGEDDKITTKDYKDMEKLWNGDVFEVFFHPDSERPVYFEYEVNQFGKQLLLTISDSQDGVSWIPFNEYRRNTYGTYNKVGLSGGQAKLDGKITSWTVEVFLSYKSLGLLPDVPPKRGTIWNANFYRLDYDTGDMVKWSWSPTIEKSFHELDKFRPIKFE